jgi:hypothetical protein
MRNALPGLIIASLLITGGITLSAIDPDRNSGTIATLLGLAGLIVTNAISAKNAARVGDKVEQMNNTIQNGALETPIKKVLTSDEAYDTMKTAVNTVMNERDNSDVPGK